MDLFTLIWGFFVGVILPVQAAANGRMIRGMGHPAYVSFWSFASAALVMAVVSLLIRAGSLQQFGAAKPMSLAGMPWWAWMGGVMGAFYVTSAAALTPRVGTVMLTVMLIAGQVVASLGVDTFGLMGSSQRDLSPMRLGGVAFVALGVMMVFKGTAGHWPWAPVR